MRRQRIVYASPRSEGRTIPMECVVDVLDHEVTAQQVPVSFRPLAGTSYIWRDEIVSREDTDRPVMLPRRVRNERV